ncbi:hypothetical protein SUDANB58_05594 [Streptomyces sp. enrichment culture]
MSFWRRGALRLDRPWWSSVPSRSGLADPRRGRPGEGPGIPPERRDGVGVPPDGYRKRAKCANWELLDASARAVYGFGPALGTPSAPGGRTPGPPSAGGPVSAARDPPRGHRGSGPDPAPPPRRTGRARDRGRNRPCLPRRYPDVPDRRGAPGHGARAREAGRSAPRRSGDRRQRAPVAGAWSAGRRRGAGGWTAAGRSRASSTSTPTGAGRGRERRGAPRPRAAAGARPRPRDAADRRRPGGRRSGHRRARWSGRRAVRPVGSRGPHPPAHVPTSPLRRPRPRTGRDAVGPLVADPSAGDRPLPGGGAGHAPRRRDPHLPAGGPPHRPRPSSAGGSAPSTG